MALTNPGNTVRVHSRNGGRASVYEANMWAQKLSGGLFSGNGVLQNTPSVNMNVKVGGTAANPDVVIASNPSGFKIALDLVSQQTILLAAPASNSRIASIVAYCDDLSINSVDNTTTGSQSSCGLIIVYGATSASPVAPTDANIRSAITTDGATGSQACYAVLTNITLTSATTTITQTMIDAGKLLAQFDGSVVLSDNSVTTRKLKPSVINFKDTGTTAFTTNSTTYVNITGASVSYTSGPTNEKVYVDAQFMWKQDTAGNGSIRILGNGVPGTDEAYTDTVPSTWKTTHLVEWFDWPANTTGTIQLQAKVTSGTLSVAKGGTSTTQSWAPSIKGFAIGR